MALSSDVFLDNKGLFEHALKQAWSLGPYLWFANLLSDGSWLWCTLSWIVDLEGRSGSSQHMKLEALL